MPFNRFIKSVGEKTLRILRRKRRGVAERGGQSMTGVALKRPPLNTIARSRRARLTSRAPSPFGRIPEQTFALFKHNIDIVKSEIAPALGHQAGDTIYDVAQFIVLDCVLRDWHENENLRGLQKDDINDLRNFIVLAYSLSQFAADSHGTVREAIFKACLSSLMSDWLDNWNSGGITGPPHQADSQFLI